MKFASLLIQTITEREQTPLYIHVCLCKLNCFVFVVFERVILGVSPHGLIGLGVTHDCNHQLVELTNILESMTVNPDILEVKCPFSARNMIF